MQRRRARFVLLGVLGLVVCVAFGLTLGGVASAKKKKKTSTTINATKAVNQIVPPAAAGTVDKDGALISTIVIGKKFKGRQIGDVNATINFTATGAGSDLSDLDIYLTAPNGATSLIFSGGTSGETLGPLTLDDESTRFLCSSATNPADNQQPWCLYPPYIGTSLPDFIPLSVMDGGPAKGTYTLSIYNSESNATEIHTFGSWSLQAATHRPFVQKD